jgi:nitrite reductase/ring-hydroxylating ferredoxin subunit/DMSO/TMAO reductase YedYZ heme-binding membrane subunit
VSVQYRAIGWNRQKRIYDSVLVTGIVLYLLVFIGVGALVYPAATAETLLIRGFGTLALLLLHVILCIGPLCRLDRRFLPLLYNRRHLGVAMFLIALVHGAFSIVQFHALGDVSPLVSLFIANTRYGSLANFPFQALGFFALLILFAMAATSHDFWLHNLSAPVWKRIHMAVYVAYGLLVAHVILGALQSDANRALAFLLGAGFLLVATLHLLAGARERRRDRLVARAAEDGFVEVCAVDGIPEKQATVISVGGERVAVFRYDGKISAVSNVCRHQNGPLGEGRIIDGCITCPWHGYQYLPESGASPAPFTDKVPTFRTRIADGKVFVNPGACPPGTPVEPARIDSTDVGSLTMNRDFYVGYSAKAPDLLGTWVARVAIGLVLAGVAVAAVLTLNQAPFADSRFEYGIYREYSGVIEEWPCPILRTAGTSFLLVAPGKHGLSAAVRGLQGKSVQLKGTLIKRGQDQMLEVLPESLREIGPLPIQALGTPIDLGPVRLRGEIVDGKCYLGVMNPGNGKVHRDCAARCISGGAPPAFIVNDAAGETRVLLLAGSDGRALNSEILSFVAEPLEIKGELVRSGPNLVLKAEPAAFLRSPE